MQIQKNGRFTRRHFLKAALAASAAPLLFPGHAQAARAQVANTRAEGIYKVIFDNRFASGIAFGEQLKRSGLPHHAIDGDITKLWFEDLDPHWAKGSAIVAGLTTARTLFCLEQLAADRRMHVSFREEHAAILEHRETLVSWVISPMNSQHRSHR